jgi:ParB-like chromosome segregation protein Spo0J
MPNFSKLLVEDLPIASLVPSKTNARTHSKRQISQIAASIRKFGFNNPILIDCENVVRAGHGRLKAAELCGMASVPARDGNTASPPRPRGVGAAGRAGKTNVGARHGS